MYSMDNKRTKTIHIIILVGILIAGFALRVAYLTADRFHADEALYAGWALLIWDGDPLLLSVPVDKPPLFLYLLAGSMRLFGSSEAAARLPALVASMLGLALTYRLGKRLYGRSTGLWAAFWLACCPFDVLFARTAFTDSMLVAWTLAALCLVVEGRWFWAGICLGLAFATKQHAVLLIPLVVAVGLMTVARRAKRGGRTAGKLILAGLGFALPFALVTWWDAARWDVRPGYWQQSAMSYGGLTWAAGADWGERLVEWLGWARYLTGSTLLNALLLAGVCVLLWCGWRRRDRLLWIDALWGCFILVYLVFHIVLRFSIWDRYLLPLAVPVSLLLARVMGVSVVWMQRKPRWARAAVVALVCLAALSGGLRAAVNGYPVGGEHWAYQGLDEVAVYLRQRAAPDAVLYHHWLRWHYTYYLHDTSFELRWWRDGLHLRQEAGRTAPDREQYIVLPDWRTLEPAAEGVCFHPVLETRRGDGSVSLVLYRLQVAPQETALVAGACEE